MLSFCVWICFLGNKFSIILALFYADDCYIFLLQLIYAYVKNMHFSLTDFE